MQVQSDVLVDAGKPDLVQREDLSGRFQEGEAKAGSDARLRSAGDDELDRWQLFEETSEDGEDGRGGLIVNAFI